MMELHKSPTIKGFWGVHIPSKAAEIEIIMESLEADQKYQQTSKEVNELSLTEVYQKHYKLLHEARSVKGPPNFKSGMLRFALV